MDDTTKKQKESDASVLRALPAVGSVLARPAIEAATKRYGHSVVVRAVREEIAEARQKLVQNAASNGHEDPRASSSLVGSVVDGPSIEEKNVSDEEVVARAGRIARGTLQPVINATGILVHTNLGRSPLAKEALAAIQEIAAGWASLEYDLEEGKRGERHSHARDLLIELTGAEDAVVVNNNAGAVLLALAALAKDREVIVSRGELVEIGGGFRIPDVLAQSGARLIEVGTTNRTHRRDYEEVLDRHVAGRLLPPPPPPQSTPLGSTNDEKGKASPPLLLKVHQSNFAMIGFTASVPVHVLAELAHAHGTALICDAGSGCLTRDFATANSGDDDQHHHEEDEPTVASLLRDGADIVTFSGDKLVGGPQSGIIVGRTKLLEPIRRHPLMRALRADKLCLAALHATLRLWLDDPSRIPLVGLARSPVKDLERRARALVDRAPPDLRSRLETIETKARLGGGTTPLRELESWGVRVTTINLDANDASDARSEAERGSVSDHQGKRSEAERGSVSDHQGKLASRLREGDPPIVARIEAGAVVLDMRSIFPKDDETVLRALIAAVGSR